MVCYSVMRGTFKSMSQENTRAHRHAFALSWKGGYWFVGLASLVSVGAIVIEVNLHFIMIRYYIKYAYDQVSAQKSSSSFLWYWMDGDTLYFNVSNWCQGNMPVNTLLWIGVGRDSLPSQINISNIFIYSYVWLWICKTVIPTYTMVICHNISNGLYWILTSPSQPHL